MQTRLFALTAALIACANSAGAISLPTHETYSAAADIGNTSFFFYDPAYTPLSSISTVPGVTTSIGGSGYTASASTTLSSNHSYAQASTFPASVYGAASFSGWYDQVTITGGTGNGTIQFNVQLDGTVNVGAIAGVVGYGLVASGVHPTVLGTDVIVDPGTPTAPWFLIAEQVNPIIGYSIVASPYNDPNQMSGLFGPTSDLGGIPSLTGLPSEVPLPGFQPDLIFTPGPGQAVDITLTGTLTFTYGEAFYLIGSLKTDLLNLDAFQPFCSFDSGCPSNPPIDGTGATTLDFSNSADLVNIVLPDGATASFASGANYNVTTVPEPSEWLMLLTGLGLVSWATRRRA